MAKSSLKLPKMVNFGDFWKTRSLRSNSVTRQINFNQTKISRKCHNSKIEMRLFWWFSNTVRWGENFVKNSQKWNCEMIFVKNSQNETAKRFSSKIRKKGIAKRLPWKIVAWPLFCPSILTLSCILQFRDFFCQITTV